MWEYQRGALDEETGQLREEWEASKHTALTFANWSGERSDFYQTVWW